MNLSWTDSVCIWAVFVKPFWTYFCKILPCLQKSLICSPIPHFLVKDHFFSFSILMWRSFADFSRVRHHAEGAGWVCSFTKCSFFFCKLAEVVPPSVALCIGGGSEKWKNSSKEVQPPLPLKDPREVHLRSTVLGERLLGSCAHHVHGAYKWPPNALPTWLCTDGKDSGLSLHQERAWLTT